MILKEDFEFSLKKPTLLLMYAGIIIDHKKRHPVLETLINSWVFKFNMVWMYTDVATEVFWLMEGINEGKSFLELSFTIPCITISMMTSVRVAPLFYQQDLVRQVIDQFRNIHLSFDELGPNNLDTQHDERKIVNDSMKILNFVINIFFYTSLAVLITFSLLPLVAIVYEYYQSGVIELVLPFIAKFPFDTLTKTRWLFIYFHQVWSTFIVFANLIGAEGLLYALCTYTKLNFQLLCHRFEALTTKYKEPNDIKEEFSRCGKRHQELIELVDKMEMLYSKSTLFNMIISSVLLCLSAFNITFQKDMGSVLVFVFFMSMTLTQTFFQSFFGDLLMRSSTEVSEAIYKSKWYKLDKGMKSSMFIVMIRSQRPSKLTALDFLNVDLMAFTAILSKSWSLFALLRSVFD